MTRRTLRTWVFTVAIFYFVAVIALIVVRKTFPGEHSAPYDTFKDLIPLIFAIPAAWLGVCFQSRSSYVSHLRSLWSEIVSAVQGALQYTHAGGVLHDQKYGSPLPSQEEYGATLTSLSCVTDKIRGVFRNVGVTRESTGLYPFESLKEIFSIVSRLGFGNAFLQEDTAKAREAIWQRWDVLRATLPLEFERDNPTFIESPYLERTHRVRNVRDAFDPTRMTFEIVDVSSPNHHDVGG